MGTYQPREQLRPSVIVALSQRKMCDEPFGVVAPFQTSPVEEVSADKPG